MIVSPTTTSVPAVFGLSVLVIVLVKLAFVVVTVALSVRLAAVPPTGTPLVTKPGPLLAPDQFTIEPANARAVPTAWVPVSFTS